MKNESERRKKYSESRKNNAQNIKKQPIILKKNDKAYAKHMETGTETITETITNTGTEKKSPKIELAFPYQSDEFHLVWNLLIQEPGWRKKSQTALQQSLLKLSKYPEADAIQMMRESIAGGWKGLFELKTQNNGNRNSKTGQPTNEDIQAAFNRSVAQWEQAGGK